MIKQKELPAEPRVDQPPMSPFIDIIFQLLIYFLLTLKLKKEEGQILQQLPKDKGLAQSAASVEPKEVRVQICAHPNKRFDQHVGLKIRHWKDLDKFKEEGQPVGDVCYVWIGDNYGEGVLDLYRTSKYPGKAGHNKEAYAAVSRRAMEIQLQLKKLTKSVPIIIDMDGLAPYEHFFGFLSFMWSQGVTDIEIAGNPKFQD